MIRDKHEHVGEGVGKKPIPTVPAWVLIAISVAGTCAAATQGKSLDWPAFILLIGVTIVALIGALATLANRSAQNGIDTAGSETPEIILSAFHKLREPSVILQGGKPVLANQAYRDLADSLGVKGLDCEPPAVERLFAKSEASASAAIFRLYHTNAQDEVNRKNIRIFAPDDTYREFEVQVNALPDGQLWQITDPVNQRAATHSLLGNAPVGLFAVKPDGTIIEINLVLKGWLGPGVGSTPENIRDFIETPGMLLDSEKMPGRTFRCDTRLFTAGDVVTPVVMAGSWQEMESGDLYASVALYGHTGLDNRARSKSVGGDAFIVAGNGNESLDHAPFGIARLDSMDSSTAKILRANEGLTAMAGQGDLTGRAFLTLFETNEALAKFANTGPALRQLQIDLHLKGPDGHPVNIYFSPEAKGQCIAYIIDISPRKELETQLIQSRKMQAIGQLAGGVAHDFNNLLQAIRLNADDLLERHPVGDSSYPELQKINQTVARAAGLVRKLLAFSSKQTLRVEVLNVSETLSDLGVLLDQVIGERVGVDMVHGRGLPAIKADKGQLETVLVNLCVNARDAMIDKGSGGRITLRSSAPWKKDLIRDDVPVPETGGYVLIEVIDSGTGMDAETRGKIFEPFFTTKVQGKGTGLGLATVYGIVQQSDGHLRLSSEVGTGTTFRVYMPTVVSDEDTSAKLKGPEIVKPTNLAGQGRILFVEDEDNVRGIAAKTLRKRGYTVVEAADGEEAYEILMDSGQPFDLLLSDVVMPGMDGPTLLRKGREMLGSTRVVFISGYAEEEFSGLLAEEPNVTFLPKPFTLTQLAEKVKMVIREGVAQPKGRS